MTPKTQQTKEIDGEAYTASLMDAETALAIFERVMRLVGPAAFEALAHAKDLPKDLSGDGLEKLSVFAPVVRVLFGGASNGEVAGLVKDLCGCCSVAVAGGKDVHLSKTFAIHFQGRTMTAFKVALFAIQVNYADFFGGLGGLLASAAAKGSASTSPSK